MLLAALLTLSVFPATAFAQTTDGETTGGQESVSYIDAFGVAHEHEAAAVTSDSVVWENGWYAVKENTEIDGRVQVRGDVNLILCNGVTLTPRLGIELFSGNSLTIWAQTQAENAMGGVTIRIPDENNFSGIDISNGSLTINGGKIQSTSGTIVNEEYSCGGAGIGGYGNVTINGGVVTAKGGDYAAGIGGTIGDEGCNVLITGGTVTAISDGGAHAIGRGDMSNNPEFDEMILYNKS